MTTAIGACALVTLLAGVALALFVSELDRGQRNWQAYNRTRKP